MWFLHFLLSAMVSLQIPPGSIFDWAESRNGLGLDRYHSQSFQLDLCWRYLCSYIHPEVLARVRKGEEDPYEWSRPPLPCAEMKESNHKSLNNLEIHHKCRLLADTPGAHVQKYSDCWVLYVSWQSVQVKFQFPLCLIFPPLRWIPQTCGC